MTKTQKIKFIINLHDNSMFFEDHTFLFDTLYKKWKKENLELFLESINEKEINEIYIKWNQAYELGYRRTNKYDE